MTPILHCSTRAAWDTAVAQGSYTADLLAQEGFIHCSTPAQILAVAGHIIQPEEYEELPELTEDMLARGTVNRVWPATVRTDPGHSASATEDATVKAGHPLGVAKMRPTAILPSDAM